LPTLIMFKVKCTTIKLGTIFFAGLINLIHTGHIAYKLTGNGASVYVFRTGTPSGLAVLEPCH
jgi:hypothetical protein